MYYLKLIRISDGFDLGYITDTFLSLTSHDRNQALEFTLDAANTYIQYYSSSINRIEKEPTHFAGGVSNNFNLYRGF